MTLARGPYLSPRARWSGEPEAIGTAAHERSMMLELASTLEEWPARNIVFRRRLDQVAQEIVRMVSIRTDLPAPPRARAEP